MHKAVESEHCEQVESWRYLKTYVPEVIGRFCKAHFLGNGINNLTGLSNEL